MIIKLKSKFQFNESLVAFTGSEVNLMGVSSPNTWHDDGDGSVTLTVGDDFRGAIVHHGKNSLTATLLGFAPEELEAPAIGGVIINRRPCDGWQYVIPATRREELEASALEAAGISVTRSIESIVLLKESFPLVNGGRAYTLRHSLNEWTGGRAFLVVGDGDPYIVSGCEDSTPVLRDGVIMSEWYWEWAEERALAPVTRFLGLGGKVSLRFEAAKRRFGADVAERALRRTHPMLAAAWLK